MTNLTQTHVTTNNRPSDRLDQIEHYLLAARYRLQAKLNGNSRIHSQANQVMHKLQQTLTYHGNTERSPN